MLLQNHGGVYHLHRIWVKGKSYGYEFPVAKDKTSASAMNNNGMRLSATYVAPPAVTATLGTEPVREVAVETAATPAPAVRTEEAPIPAQDAAPATPPISAQAAAPASPAIEPAVQATPEMPKTASIWVMLLLSGCAGLSLGLFVRTYRERL